MPEVAPEILKWARDNAGLSLEDAAKGVISGTKKATAAARLKELEDGTNTPTLPQLIKLSDKYRQPLLVFYLDEPPLRGDRGTDFRTVPGSGQPERDLVLDTLIRDIKVRHSLVQSLLLDEDTPEKEYVGSARISHGTDKVASSLVDEIGFDFNEFHGMQDLRHAFRYLHTKLEEAGIFVLLAGNLGSHHTNVSRLVFRGFSIADPIAPMIVINENDAPEAWPFTALHEAAHIWLGETGISGNEFNSKIEGFCNEVAGSILLPESVSRYITVSTEFKDLSGSELFEAIFAQAKKQNLSKQMLAYRLYLRNHISEAQWNVINDRLKEHHSNERVDKKNNSRRGGPNHYVIKRRNIGQSLLNLVDAAIGDGSLTYTKAAMVLGVRPLHVSKLLNRNV